MLWKWWEQVIKNQDEKLISYIPDEQHSCSCSRISQCKWHAAWQLRSLCTQEKELSSWSWNIQQNNSMEYLSWEQVHLIVRSPSDLSESSGMIPDFGSVSQKKRSATKMIGEQIKRPVESNADHLSRMGRAWEVDGRRILELACLMRHQNSTFLPWVSIYAISFYLVLFWLDVLGASYVIWFIRSPWGIPPDSESGSQNTKSASRKICE